MESTKDCFQRFLDTIAQESSRYIPFPAHQIIYSQETASTGCYLLDGGEIELCYRTLSGRKYILDFARRPELIGIEAIFSKSYAFTAETITDSKLRFIPTDNIKIILANQPQVQYQLMNELFRKLHAAFRRIAIRIESGALTALAHGLLQMAYNKQAVVGNEHGEIDRTVEELAEFILFSNRSTFRALQQMQDRGAISRDQRGRFTLNISELKKIDDA